MNTIAINQNKKENLEMLSARKILYGKSKSIFYIRCLISIVFVIFIFIKIDSEVFKSIVALSSILFLLLDMYFIEKLEIELRKHAAKVQELFDCTVLELRWNYFLINEMPEHELIYEGSQRYLSKFKSYDKLKDWYSKDVSAVDLRIGRVLCQRSNIYWDSKQRNKFAFVLSCFAISIIVVIMIIAICNSWKISDLLLFVIIPILPFFSILLQYIDGQRKAAKRLTELKSGADALIKISKTSTDEEMISQSRLLQNELFNHRIATVPIPDWYYSLLRNKLELQMNYSIKETIKDLNL